MNAYEMLSLIGDVDDSIIREARTKPKALTPQRTKWVLIAAGLAAAVCMAVIGIAVHTIRNSSGNGFNAVVVTNTTNSSEQAETDYLDEPATQVTADDLTEEPVTQVADIHADEAPVTESYNEPEAHMESLVAEIEETSTQMVDYPTEDPATQVADYPTEDPATQVADNHTEAPEPAIETDDLVSINTVMQNENAVSGWLNPNPDLYMDKVTVMSVSDLTAYYGVKVDDAAIAGILQSVTGESISVSPNSLYYDGFGVYRDGEYIFDQNYLLLVTEDRSVEVRIVLSRSTNIAYPGSRYIQYPESDESLAVSRLNGVECIIKQFEIVGFVDESTYAITAEIGETKVEMTICGPTKDQALDAAGRILKLMEE